MVSTTGITRIMDYVDQFNFSKALQCSVYCYNISTLWKSIWVCDHHWYSPNPLQPPPGTQPHIPSDMGHAHALITVTCGYPPAQLLQHPIVVVNASQLDSHPLIEGQFITYTCPPGFTLTGPNISVCTGNREWEPDPGNVDCIGE